MNFNLELLMNDELANALGSMSLFCVLARGDMEPGHKTASQEHLGPVQIVADRLAWLYADELSLRRLLALANVDAARIPFDGRSANMAWFATVETARQGRLAELVGVALEEYPLDPWLVGVYARLVKKVNARAELRG